MTLRHLEPNWPAPPGIRAASTLRGGGVSLGAYASLNLGLHVGDEASRVEANRARLMDHLRLPAPPQWLTQVHGQRAIEAGQPGAPAADAAYTWVTGQVCAVMTADCLPILLCRRDGAAVAAVHAGWKGLAGGVVQSSLAALGTADVLAWLGPAIGPDAFAVGDDVRNAFIGQDCTCAAAFRQMGPERYLADLYRLARILLGRAGVGLTDIYGGGWCTHRQSADFFSYRRDRVTGRMATLIWRE